MADDNDVVFPYPTTLQAEQALAVVWAKLTGGTGVTVKKLTNAGYCLEGYALSIGMPKFSPAAFSTDADLDLELKKAINPHLQPHMIGDGTILKNVGGILQTLPWQQILPILLAWIPKAAATLAA